MRRDNAFAAVGVAVFLLVAPAGAGGATAYGRLPLRFEPNLGQAGLRGKFVSRGSHHQFLLEPTGIELQLGREVVHLGLVGANQAPAMHGAEPLPGHSNYYTGGGPARWQTGVPHFARVRYEAVYPGVDLVFYGNQGELEYDFVLAPGVAPRVIRLRYKGPHAPRLAQNGDLVLPTARSEVRFRRPAIYQETAAGRKTIRGGYRLRGRLISFSVGAHDVALPLVIDPVLSYSTYLGGWGEDLGVTIAVDATGAAYIAGHTSADDFPVTPEAIQGKFGGEGAYSLGDAFIAKLDPSGSALVYATYLGGGNGDGAAAIAIDAGGNAYLAGWTGSSGFPTTAGALRRTLGPGPRDEAFVVKLDPTGKLVYSTLLGDDSGNNTEGNAIAVDSAGNVYVGGVTNAPSFPVTAGVLQNKLRGENDGFVAKLNAAGSALLYATYLGGSLTDTISGLGIDSQGAAYVAGTTESSDFPVNKAAQARYGGKGYSCGDAFAAKLNPAATALVYATYLGGTECDRGGRIAVAESGAAYIVGLTGSPNFPTTAGALETKGKASRSSSDGFAVRLNSDGSLGYATYLGGTGDDAAHAVAVDAAGNAWIAGETRASDFPVLNGVQPDVGANSNAFVVQLNAQGSALLHGSLLGYGGEDRAYGVALDAAGDVYVTGSTEGPFPTVFAVQEPGMDTSSSSRRPDAFVAKIGWEATVSTASYRRLPLAPASFQSFFGANLASGISTPSGETLPTSLGGVSVKIVDSAGVERLAALSLAAPGQVNYLVPEGVAAGPARVTLTAGDGKLHRDAVPVAAVAPGLFTANASGQGVAAAFAVRVSPSGAQTTLPVARYDAARGQFVSEPVDLGDESDQLILLLFGTGIRGAAALSDVRARIGGDDAEVLYAGPQGQYAGLDQVNVRVPRSVLGFGDTDVLLTVNQQPANAVTLNLAGIPRPRISMLSQWGTETAQTIATFTVQGRFLSGATGITFTPADGVTVEDFTATASQATARLVIAAGAATGPRQLSIVTPGGASVPVRFNIRPQGTPAAPVISNATLSQSALGRNVITTGRFDFTDADGDLVYTGLYSPPTLLFGPSNCVVTARGPFFDRPGQTSGTISFALQAPVASVAIGTSFTINVTVIDAGGHRSNTVQVPMGAWVCPRAQ